MQKTPHQRYQQDLTRDGFTHDPAQENAVAQLQQLYEKLLYAQKPPHKIGLLSKLAQRRRSPKNLTPIQGLYFWGGVGRGKTYLMDNFFECLPFEKKMRTHFHRFMRSVHKELTLLHGNKNPLDAVANKIAANAVILCFDEFFVTDITDAMILGTLLEKLFARGVTLVATSNIEPKYLYQNGLQRQRFIPAIELLYQHTQIVNVDGGVDYRLRALTQAELYHSPLDDLAQQSLYRSFRNLVPAEEEIRQNSSINIENRPIDTQYIGEDVVWFNFTDLCDGPRSQNDYIEIAREFHAVLVSNVPQLGREKDDQARRFISMVDEFYDRNVKLIISAAIPLENLYTDGKLNFEFQRTLSRLLEMQSHQYLALAHRP